MITISKHMSHAILLAGLLSALSWAQPEKRPMTLVDLLEVPSLSDPQLSLDGRHLLFVLAEPDWEINGRVRHIWRADLKGGASTQMTNGSGGEWSPRWSPDGKSIAFLAQRGPSRSPQIYLMNTGGGEARQLSNHVASRPVEDAHFPPLSEIRWSPDGDWIYFAAFDPPSPEEEQREKSKDDVYAFNENYEQRHLWKISPADGVEHRITEGDFSVLSYALARDGEKVVLHQAPNPRHDYGNRGEVWVMNADGTEPVQLTRNNVPEAPNCCGGSGARLSPDNRRVLFLAKSNEKFEFQYKASIFVVPASGGAAELLLPDLPYEVKQASWSMEGDAIYFVANMGVHSELFRLELSTQKVHQLTDAKHRVHNWNYQPSADLHVFAIDQPGNPGDFWVLPALGAGTPTRVTKRFDYLTQDFELPRQEMTAWKGVDGVRIEGMLHYPLNYEAGKRYPFVMQLHGGMGSSNQYGFGGWRDFIAMLAAQGYAVLEPNYRGSGGYGSEFERDIMGHFFNNSHLDIMAGADHVIEMGIADSDRMVVMGWSSGGYLTNKIITFTDRFKAASSGASAVNWISFYSQSDVRYFRTAYFLGTPWQKDNPIENYWEQSPLSQIANVTTPTLVLVGEEDVRVPAPQSVELYRALKSNGVPTRLYIAPREGHGWRELRHQLFKMNAELDWFEKYAMGRDYTWEKAPVETTDDEKGKGSTQP